MSLPQIEENELDLLTLLRLGERRKPLLIVQVQRKSKILFLPILELWGKSYV
jgi:hypothetical protein